MKIRFILFNLFILSILISAQNYTQSFIAIKNTGVEQFHIDYPEYDGRGTIIFVFDTGVDMGVDGLIKTSTGETKVIDAQDFTGQGDIMFYEADIDDEDGVEFFFNEDEELKINGAGKLNLKAADNEYYIGVLPESIWQNSGSGITDINGNGSTNDNFYFVTFEVDDNNQKYWVLYLDSDNDGDLADEEAFRNYKESLKPLFIKTKDNLPLLTIAINIFPEMNKVSFFFDDGSHGTHCAGIASGYNIGNNGFNGVAPGAKIVACKIGNNNYSGGATVAGSMEKAFLYADKYSREVEEPCIISMSYGIGSEIEGHSEMEVFIDKLVKDNPYLYMSLSNSNEGPGISSTGLPSASSSELSTGAVLTKEVAADAYGAVIDEDIILHFSSRGAAVLKPDVVAPGAAIATVPNHAGGDRMWGTSMAAPYSTGVISLLLSSAEREFPEVKIPSLMLYRVIRESAVPMKGYDHVDQGGGYINVLAAWNLLKNLIKAGEISKFETYTINALAPNMPGQTAPGLYIRNGAYLNGTESFKYEINRNNFINSSKFYRTYYLKSDSDWLLPAQKKLHIRNDQSAKVDVSFDKSILAEPGLYNGKIYATRADKSNASEFELMATVVIPYLFDSRNSYVNNWENIEVAPGVNQRYFLRVPAGSSDIRFKIASGANEFTHVRYFLYDNDGRERLSGVFNAGMQEDFHEEYFINPEPGVYELDIVGYYTDNTISVYDLTVDMNGIKRVEDEVLTFGSNTFKIINLFDELKNYNIKGEIIGFKKEFELTISSSRSCEIPFTFNDKISSKKFDLFMTKEDFNKLTDLAMVAYNDKGKSIKSGSISYQFADLVVENKSSDESKYILKLIPGLANIESSLKVKLTEYTYFSQPTQINIKNKKCELYPTSIEDVNIEITQPDYSIPDDAQYWGKCYLINPSTNKTETEFLLLLNK